MMTDPGALVCPCCGHATAVHQADLARLAMLPLGKHGKVILRKLSAAFPAAVCADDLITALWGASPYAYTDSARSTLRVKISKIRDRLRPVGWTIPANYGRPTLVAGFRLKMLVNGK